MSFRRLHVLLLLCVSTSALPAQQRGSDAQERERVLAAIEGFLQGMRTKDSTLMLRSVDSTSRFTLLRPGPNGTRVVVVTAAQFIGLATRPDRPALDEPIRNPVIQMDGDLASVWAEYQVRRPDGTVSHCGYDAFHVARVSGEWKIINVSDTFRQVGCGERWP